MDDPTISTVGGIAGAGLALVVAALLWAPALVGFMASAATAAAWCWWMEAHPDG